jgi:hypothetical protein
MEQSPKQKKGSAPTLWLIYIGERKTTFVKAYGIQKRGAIDNLLGNIARTWGT